MPNEDSNTTPVESGNPDTTQAAAVNSGTTPSGAEQTENTQAAGGNDGTTPDINTIVEKRLARARKQWEAEAEEQAKRARMDEAERLKAELADKEKAIAERDAQIKRERTLRQLAGKVIDPEDALAIAERNDLVDDDGNVDLAKLLDSKPFLAPQTAAGVNIPGARNAKKPTLTVEDINRMKPHEINERWDEVQAALKGAR